MNPIPGSLACNPDRRIVFRNKRLLFASADQLVKYKDAIRYAGGNAEVFHKETIVNKSSDVMILASSSSLKTEAWKKAVTKYKQWELNPVLESQIALAILHASCDNYCNPAKKYKVLGTPSSSTQGSRSSTLATATQDTFLMSNSGKSEHCNCIFSQQRWT